MEQLGRRSKNLLEGRGGSFFFIIIDLLPFPTVYLFFFFPSLNSEMTASVIFLLLYWNSSVVSTQECPLGTFKNVTGSDRALCISCPNDELPHRAVYISVRGMTNDEMFTAKAFAV